MSVRALLAAGLLLASLTVAIQDAGSSPSGPLVIAGHGPELPTIEMLARAFERANPRIYIDILWDENSKTVDMSKKAKGQTRGPGLKNPNYPRRRSPGVALGSWWNLPISPKKAPN